MEVYRYLNVVRKHLILIVLLTVLGGGAAFAFSKRQPSVYQASSTLLLNPAQPAAAIPYAGAAAGANNIVPVDQLANTYSVYITSRSFDRIVVRKLRLNIPGAALGGHITSALVPNTNYFTISVTWGDSRQAARIANTIARTFISENAKAQQALQNTSANAEIQQGLRWFRAKIAQLQTRYDHLVANPHSSVRQVQQAQNNLDNLNEIYFKLLATVGPNMIGGSANTASLAETAQAGVLIAPNVRRSALEGLLAGLLLGLALAFLLDYLDYSLRTPEDLEQLVGQTPLGIIGKIHTDERGGRGGLLRIFRRPRRAIPVAASATQSNGHASANGHVAAGTALQDGSLAALPVLDARLVTLNQPKAPISEAFRILRTNLDFSSLDKPLKSLVVTSSLPSEGKSTVAANLAVSMAQAGKRVILVEADLRRPSVAKVFKLPPTIGLTTVLLHRTDLAHALDEALQQTMVPNLQVVTSGPLPPNPAELLASEMMTHLLRDLEARSDLVIFDTPPMGPLTDALVLSARVSGTLVVVRAGSTRRTVITNGMNMVRKVGGNVVGTVLNMVDIRAISNYSYYYYYQSEYYGQEETPAAARS